MALDFLGGLGMAAGAIKRGYEQQVDRDAQLEDREFTRQQREFQRTQQQRALEEQRRADELRKADAAVATTEQSSRSAEGTIYGQQAPVLRDDDGNMMPGAVETKPAETITRNRNMFDVYRDFAKNRRQIGDTEGALKFEQSAIKIATDQASRQATALMAQSGNMSLEQYAGAARKVFDNDALPQSITGIKSNTDGSVDVTIRHSTTGEEINQTFKSKDDVTKALRALYQPEQYAQLLTKQLEIQAEIEKDPYKQVPGGYIDKRTGKFTATMVGQDVIATNADGTPIYGTRAPGGAGGAGGAGGGSSKAGGKAPPTGLEQARELYKDAAGKSDGTPEWQARFSQGQEWLEAIYELNPSIQPGAANNVVAQALKDPSKITPQIDYRTGQVGLTFVSPEVARGQPYTLAPAGSNAAAMEKIVGRERMAQAVGGMIQSLAGSVPEEQQAAFAQQLREVASNPAARAEYLKAAKAAGKDTSVIQRQLDLIGQYSPIPKAAPAAAGGLKPTQAQKDAARAYGFNADAPTAMERITQGARGLARGISNVLTPGESFAKATAQKIQATGKIEQGDAVALAQAIAAKPELKQLFTPQQLDAIQVISGKQL